MVVRMRHTRAHTRNRRSHHGLKAPNLSTCSHCGEAHRPHHMCLHCGYYKDRQVIDLEGERAKREARMKAKQEAIRAESGPVAPVEDVATPEETNDTKATESKKKEGARRAKTEVSDEKREESEKHSVKDDK